VGGGWRGVEVRLVCAFGWSRECVVGLGELRMDLSLRVGKLRYEIGTEIMRDRWNDRTKLALIEVCNVLYTVVRISFVSNDGSHLSQRLLLSFMKISFGIVGLH
jgi:hypothetical protein